MNQIDTLKAIQDFLNFCNSHSINVYFMALRGRNLVRIEIYYHGCYYKDTVKCNDLYSKSFQRYIKGVLQVQEFENLDGVRLV